VLATGAGSIPEGLDKLHVLPRARRGYLHEQVTTVNPL
jgi:hypothetical protein